SRRPHDDAAQALRGARRRAGGHRRRFSALRRNRRLSAHRRGSPRGAVGDVRSSRRGGRGHRSWRARLAGSGLGPGRGGSSERAGRGRGGGGPVASSRKQGAPRMTDPVFVTSTSSRSLASLSSPRGEWSGLTRLFFRFACVLFFLYFLPFPIGALPGT